MSLCRGGADTEYEFTVKLHKLIRMCSNDLTRRRRRGQGSGLSGVAGRGHKGTKHVRDLVQRLSVAAFLIIIDCRSAISIMMF
ncbi:MAG: hypothetical protein LBQ03_02420 [Puniceicoccales bacterium]|nr:hypothetical protein [Puniceicoccales bacterium]